MAAATLTEDQRWLLYVAARHVMPIALLDPDYGIRGLKASHGSPRTFRRIFGRC